MVDEQYNPVVDFRGEIVDREHVGPRRYSVVVEEQPKENLIMSFDGESIGSRYLIEREDVQELLKKYYISPQEFYYFISGETHTGEDAPTAQCIAEVKKLVDKHKPLQKLHQLADYVFYAENLFIVATMERISAGANVEEIDQDKVADATDLLKQTWYNLGMGKHAINERMQVFKREIEQQAQPSGSQLR